MDEEDRKKTFVRLLNIDKQKTCYDGGSLVEEGEQKDCHGLPPTSEGLRFYILVVKI